jgi:hypothetical protein
LLINKLKMRIMRTRFLIVAIASSLLAGCAATKSLVLASDVGNQTVVLGWLGRPIGTELAIHGHKLPWEVKSDPRAFLVDSVDGQKLARPVALFVRGIQAWPDNAEATIRGQEVGVIEFGYAFASGPPDEPRRQIVNMSFEPLEVIEPKNLKLGDEK